MIYCVEDDRNIRELIVYTLTSSGLDAIGVEDGQALFALDNLAEADLILLDIMLPGEDGLTLLSRLKSSARLCAIPVIMITARDAEYDKVTGLNLGADDYITKPFGMMEFIARVRAVLRRASQSPVNKDDLTFGELCLCRKAHQVMLSGRPIDLTLKEFDLLYCLLLNQGVVMSRPQLLNQVWGYDFDGMTRTVDVHIRTLRHKLGAFGHHIMTIRGVGYKLA